MLDQRIFRALSAAVAAAVLSGCSSSGLSMSSARPAAHVAVPARSSNSSIDASTPLLYASQNNVNKILIYDQAGTNQAPIGSLTTSLNGPLGMWVAPNHDLYVVNQLASAVIVYHRGATSPYKMLSDPGYLPVEVVVDKTRGTVFVANTQTTGGGPGNVAVYAHGSTTPTSTLTMPSNFAVKVARIDKNHNLWVDYLDTSGTDFVAEFVNEKNPAKATSVSVGDLRGMLFTSSNALVLVDTSVPNVQVWPAPFNHATKICAAAGGPRGPRQISPSAVHPGYFVADVNNTAIEEVTYSNCATVDTITQGLSSSSPASHIATDPD